MSPILENDRKHVWHPFTQELTAPAPIEVVAGAGAVLKTADGRELVDLVSSWWVNIHGHAHPYIAQAIAKQATILEQVIFAGFTHAPAVQLATRLQAKLPASLTRFFYSDNGSTAVEVSLKMAYQYWRNCGMPERTRFLAFEGGYHGDTVGAMSVGRTSGFYDPFHELMFSVGFVPYPETWEDDEAVLAKETHSLEVVEEYCRNWKNEIAAVIIEPLVQGAGGMRMCRPEFLRKLADLLSREGILLIFDEIMTGFGRTGSLFASLKAGVTPDLLCLSKGITGGFLPLSVTVCSEKIYEAFLGETFDRAFVHGHSYTANPLACAAALASFDLFEHEHTLERVANIEAVHRERLNALAHTAGATKRRVCGSIGAVDVAAPDSGYTSAVGPFLKQYFLERGFLLRPLGNVAYFLPPFCLSSELLHKAYDVLADGFAALGHVK